MAVFVLIVQLLLVDFQCKGEQRGVSRDEREREARRETERKRKAYLQQPLYV